MKKSKYNNFQEFMLKIQKRFQIFLALPVPAFIFLFIRVENGNFSPGLLGAEPAFYLRNTMGILTFIVIILSVLFFFFNMQKMDKNRDLRSKLDHYYKISFVRDIFLDVILVINLCGMAITGERFYVGFFGISLIVFLLGYPNPMRIVHLLKLDQRETDIITKSEKID